MNPYMMNAFLDELGLIKESSWKSVRVPGNVPGDFAQLVRTPGAETPNLLEMVRGGKKIRGKINYGNTEAARGDQFLPDDIGKALRSSYERGNFVPVHMTARRLYSKS